MWHSILMILKIVLLILAAVLGLGILVLALLLFVPVRYEIHIRKKEELQAEARVHWLLHLIRLPVSYLDGELSAKVKVLFFTVKDLLAGEQEIREGAREVFTDWEEDTEADREEQTETAAGQDAEEADAGETSAEAVEKEVEKEPENRTEEPAHKKKKASGSPVKSKLRNLKYTLHRFYVKIKRIKRFATDERTRAAVSLAWSQLKRLLRRLLPRKVRGEVRFGTGDPALTGQILGGISIFYPLFMDNVKVTPDFQETVLEGELYAKGRIRLFTVARIAWKLYRDKNIRFVYRRLG